MDHKRNVPGVSPTVSSNTGIKDSVNKMSLLYNGIPLLTLKCSCHPSFLHCFFFIIIIYLNRNDKQTKHAHYSNFTYIYIYIFFSSIKLQAFCPFIITFIHLIIYISTEQSFPQQDLFISLKQMREKSSLYSILTPFPLSDQLKGDWSRHWTILP